MIHVNNFPLAQAFWSIRTGQILIDPKEFFGSPTAACLCPDSYPRLASSAPHSHILIPKMLDLFGLAHLHATLLGLSRIDRVFADGLWPSYILFFGRSSLLLLLISFSFPFVKSYSEMDQAGCRSQVSTRTLPTCAQQKSV